jgi:type IV secretory pathway VirB6-like protein
VTDFFQNSSLNIITQTPPNDSYDNTMIGDINKDLVRVVDVALACLLLIGGYNVIIGHHWQIERASITELIPRAILVTCAVHFNLFFLGLFIDLNNALCNTVITAASAQTLTNIIGGFLSINLLAGLMLIILIIVVFILLILLLAQMITRIALVALLIAVAPLALACFVLPQTMRWGRLWFTTFSSAVLVQFLQVTALALGGLLITSIGNTANWHVAHELTEVFLAIGMVIITLKIPGMLQTWALHPMMASSGMMMDQAASLASGGASSGSSGSSGEAAATVAELIALL